MQLTPEQLQLAIVANQLEMDGFTELAATIAAILRQQLKGI